MSAADLRAIRNSQLLWARASLIISVIGIYWNTTAQGFVGDDWYWLYNARFTMSHVSGWVQAFTRANGSGQYRPLTQNCFFWLTLHIFGLHPFGYHIVILIIYIATVLIIFQTVINIIDDKLVAFSAVLPFAVAPLHYSGLSWISAFAETGAILFIVLALYFLLTKRVNASYLAYALCLLANETASVFPAIAFLYSFAYQNKTINASIKSTWIYGAMFAIYMLLRFTIIGFHPHGAFTSRASIKLTVAHMIGTLTNILGFAPTLYNVTHAIGIAGAIPRVTKYLYCSIGLMALIMIIEGAIADAKARSLVVFGIGIGFFGLLPELAFSQHDWALYNLGIPDIGIVFVMASLGVRGVKWGHAKRAVAVATGGLFFLLSAAQIWGSGGNNEVQGLNVLGRQVTQAYQYISKEMRQKHLEGQVVVRIKGDRTKYTYWMMGHNYGIDLLIGVPHGGRVCYNYGCHANITLRWDQRTQRFEWLSRAEGVDSTSH